MKPEFSKVLIPPSVTFTKPESNYGILKAFFICASIIVFGLTIVRYENQLSEIEVRLASLEIVAIQAEDQVRAYYYFC